MFPNLGVVDSLTRLILVNAIHFKANWKLPFEETNTKEEPFHVSKTQTVPVQMMHIKKKFGFTHSEELKAKILELEYEVKCHTDWFTSIFISSLNNIKENCLLSWILRFDKEASLHLKSPLLDRITDKAQKT